MISQKQLLSISAMLIILGGLAVYTTLRNTRQPFQAQVDQNEGVKDIALVDTISGRVERITAEGIEMRKIVDAHFLPLYTIIISPETIVTQVFPERKPSTLADIQRNDYIVVYPSRDSAGNTIAAQAIDLFKDY